MPNALSGEARVDNASVPVAVGPGAGRLGTREN